MEELSGDAVGMALLLSCFSLLVEIIVMIS